MSIGKRIIQRREELGMTTSALAKKIGVTQQVVFKWENEYNKMTITSAAKVANALGVTLDYLILGTPATLNSWPVNCKLFYCEKQAKRQCCYFCTEKKNCEDRCFNDPFKCGAALRED